MLDYLNPVSDKFILKDVVEFLKAMLDYLNPTSEKFMLKGVFDFLGSILSYINPFSENFFAYKLLELLGELLKNLFIPSEERLSAISNTVTSKFAFIDSIKEGVNAVQNMFNNLGNSPKLESSNIESKYFNGKLTIIDMSWYAPFKPFGDLVITGFSYVFFIWRLFVTLPNTINAVGGGVGFIDRSDDD